VEIPDWNCCGATSANNYDSLLGAVLSGRNLAIAEAAGFDTVMTPCPGCLKSLKAAVAVRDEQPDDFAAILKMPFTGNIRNVSILQLLHELAGSSGFRDLVKRPLDGMVIVPYYGCLLTRPPEVAGFDDPENPVSMDELLRAVGATVPEFPFKTECCGAAYGVTRNEIVGKLTGRILDMAKRVGGAAICVACPLCQQNLDLRQSQVNRLWTRTFDVPVLYITQLVGYGLGLDPALLGIHKLFVNADNLFQTASDAVEDSV
jgi:heterodisulfide reductase subunit B